ncbi:MAG: hypothetical protein Kow0090_00940 [Myxococcota bacterium]
MSNKKARLRILLLNPPLQYLHTTTFMLPNIAPVGLLSLAGVAEKRGCDIRALDSALAPHFSNTALKEATAFNPDIIGVSVHFPPDALRTWEMVGELREALPKSIIIAGGPIPTYIPETFLHSGCDCVVVGEGEESFAELISVISEGGREFSQVRGLCLLDDKGNLLRTAPREPINDLDSLPFLPFRLLPPYPALSRAGRASAMETLRGCPFACEFCSTPSFWGRVRYFSNERILAQLDIFREQRITEVFFVDDIFALHPEKYIALLEEIIRRDYRMAFAGCLRADYAVRYPELVSLMAKAGFYLLNVGFEEYNDDALAAIGKRTSREVNLFASKILRKNGIVVLGSHIYGAPGESEEELSDSVKTGIKNSDIFRMSIYTPHLGSPLYERLKRTGVYFNGGLERQSYWHYNIEDDKDGWKMQRRFLVEQLRYYFSLRTMARGAGLEGKIKGRLVRRAYYSAGMFAVFAALRGLGIKVL